MRWTLRRALEAMQESSRKRQSGHSVFSSMPASYFHHKASAAPAQTLAAQMARYPLVAPTFYLTYAPTDKAHHYLNLAPTRRHGFSMC